MDWHQLTDEQGLETIKEESNKKPVVIFKHSTRCSISSAALSRLERSWKKEEMEDVDMYYLDLLKYRPISSKIAEEFNVKHESPQLLIINNGKCTYHVSHMGISYNDLKQKVKG